MSDRPDIFISYSHSEHEWVTANVSQQLQRCRRKRDQQRPSIFIDRNRVNGIPPGHGWRIAVNEALKTCHKFVAIYSEPYHASDECQWEFGIAFDRDPVGKKGIVISLLCDRSSPPDYAKNTQFISVLDQPDWFDRLCGSLDLVPEPERLTLHFVTQPNDVQVNETLRPVRVHICSESGTLYKTDDIITVRSTQGSLQGENSKPALNGVVEFDDLSLEKSAKQPRLEVSGDGFEPVLSQPFRVRRPAAQSPPPQDDGLPVAGQPVFFANGTAIAIIGDGGVRAFSVPDRMPIFAEPLILKGPLRLVAQAKESLVLADWEGYVYLIFSKGAPQAWQLRDEQRSLNIIGAITAAVDDVYVGLWSGEVFRFYRGEAPQLHLQHPAGVQAMAVSGNRLAIAGLDGNLVIYTERRRERTVMLEPIIRLMKSYSQHLTVVGRTKLFQVPWNGGAVLEEKTALDDVLGVYGDSDLPVLIDRQGRGFFINGELSNCGQFYTAPGAIPTSANNAGSWCVFRNADGVHTLLTKTAGTRQAKIVRSWHSAMAINPAGSLLAIVDPPGVRLLKPLDFASANPA